MKNWGIMNYKINKNKIKAIIIDSGRVLNGPATGHWFITPNFFNYIDEEKYKTIDVKQRNKAFNLAGNCIKTKFNI